MIQGVTPQGFIRPSLADLQIDELNRAKIKYNLQFLPDPASKIGVEAYIRAAQRDELLQIAEECYYSGFVSTATGASLERKAFPLKKQAAVSSKTYLSLFGTAGTIVNLGTLFETVNKIQFKSLSSLTLTGGNPSGHADGTGAAASFNLPEGGVFDSVGNLFICDTGNHTIRKITSAGVVTTFAGQAGVSGHANGTGSAATFKNPTAITVDNTDNLYVCDTGNHTIRKITPGGVVTTFAGQATISGHADGTGTAATFNAPEGIGIDSTSNLFVCDTGNNLIRKITAAAAVTTFAGTYGVTGHAHDTGTAASFNLPTWVTLDPSNNMYVADTNNHTIRKITAAAVVTTFAGTPTIPGSVDGTGTAARFNFPEGIDMDSAGNLFICDTQNNTIRKITSGGVVTTFAGKVGVLGHLDGAGTAATFYNPTTGTIDISDNIFICDTPNNLIRKITPAGVVTTFAGSAGDLVQVEALVPGVSGNLSVNTITYIPVPVPGLKTCTNYSQALGGVNKETDIDFINRIIAEESSTHSSSLNDIVVAIRDVPGVIFATGYENTTNVTDAAGRPPGAFEIVVQGGTDADIANAILINMAAGTEPWGSSSVSVTDIAGNAVLIYFSRITTINIYCTTTLTVDGTYNPTVSDPVVKQRILEYIGGVDPLGVTWEGIPIGTNVIAFRAESSLFDPLNQNMIPGLLSAAITFGAGAPGGASSITISANQKALTDYAYITVTP